jgi:hypothetical protein
VIEAEVISTLLSVLVSDGAFFDGKGRTGVPSDRGPEHRIKSLHRIDHYPIFQMVLYWMNLSSH